MEVHDTCLPERNFQSFYFINLAFDKSLLAFLTFSGKDDLDVFVL